MTLLYDDSRCCGVLMDPSVGFGSSRTCPLRDRCLRFTDIRPGVIYRWIDPPYDAGRCGMQIEPGKSQSH